MSLVERMQRDYPHRLPDWRRAGWCPVCAGDGITSDPRYACGPRLARETPAPVYVCLICGGTGKVSQEQMYR